MSMKPLIQTPSSTRPMRRGDDTAVPAPEAPSAPPAGVTGPAIDSNGKEAVIDRKVIGGIGVSRDGLATAQAPLRAGGNANAALAFHSARSAAQAATPSSPQGPLAAGTAKAISAPAIGNDGMGPAQVALREKSLARDDIKPAIAEAFVAQFPQRPSLGLQLDRGSIRLGATEEGRTSFTLEADMNIENILGSVTIGKASFNGTYELATDEVSFTATTPLLDPATVVGLSLNEAGNKITAAGYSFRVVSVDGASLPVTEEFAPSRISLTIIDDKVSEADIG